MHHTILYHHPQRSCGKVVFSQASVSHSVHRWGGCGRHPLGSHPAADTPWAVTQLGSYTLGKHRPGHTPCPKYAGIHSPRPVHAGIHTSPRPPSPPHTAADSTHPTGMHFCFYCGYNTYFKNMENLKDDVSQDIHGNIV